VHFLGQAKEYIYGTFDLNVPSLIVEPCDGLPYLEIPSYTLERYSIYRIIFAEWTKWMKPKAEWIGYMDLTAGPGYSRVRGYSKMGKNQVAATPIISLKTEPNFTHLIFIERERAYCNALGERIKTFYKERDCRILHGDANEYIRSALKFLEGHCLVCVDPFRPTDIKWETLEKILEEEFCDLLGAYPAPLTQRVIGRRRGRLYVPGVHEHMPPGFQLNIKKGALKTSAEFCRKKVKEMFQRNSVHCLVRRVPYPIMFCTKDYKLADQLYQKLKLERCHDEIIHEK